VVEIILPTNTGQMGVLTNHAPIITALDIMLCQFVQTKIDVSSIMGGRFVKQKNQITILVNSAESKDKIDAAGAEKLFRSTEAAE
jgi:F-type H+-transporting ATPase subunit epsilon